jgi:hypothetical protein
VTGGDWLNRQENGGFTKRWDWAGESAGALAPWNEVARRTDQRREHGKWIFGRALLETSRKHDEWWQKTQHGTKTKSMSARWIDQSQAWKNGASAPCWAEGLAADLLGKTDERENPSQGSSCSAHPGHRSWESQAGKNLRQKQNFSIGKKGTTDRRAGGKILRERWMNLDKLDVKPKKNCAEKKQLEPKQRGESHDNKVRTWGKINLCADKNLGMETKTSTMSKLLWEITKQHRKDCSSIRDSKSTWELPGARHRWTTRRERNRSRPRAPDNGGKWISFRSKNFRSDENQEGKVKSVNKNNFSIEIKTDSHTITEVTVVPPSFDWKLKTRSWLTSTLENWKQNWKVTSSHIHSMVIYICSNKKLNNYYAARA